VEFTGGPGPIWKCPQTCAFLAGIETRIWFAALPGEVSSLEKKETTKWSSCTMTCGTRQLRFHRDVTKTVQWNGLGKKISSVCINDSRKTFLQLKSYSHTIGTRGPNFTSQNEKKDSLYFVLEKVHFTLLNYHRNLIFLHELRN
jgi:hypothetical protein